MCPKNSELARRGNVVRATLALRVWYISKLKVQKTGEIRRLREHVARPARQYLSLAGLVRMDWELL